MAASGAQARTCEAKASDAADAAHTGLNSLKLDFGEASAVRRSWRDATLTDWELRLDGRTYHVHKTILAQGERMSHFFLAQFQRWEERGCTDLESLLPEPCWPALEPALDFIYDGSIQLEAANVVPVLKLAHVLQIPTLGHAALGYLQANLSRASALTILASALQLQPGLEPLVEECLRVVAREFDGYACEAFAQLPAETVLALLGHAELRSSARHASRAAAAYVRAAVEAAAPNVGELFELFSPHMKEVQPEDGVFLLGRAIELGREECRAAFLRAVVQNFAQVDVRELATIPDHDTVIELLDDDELASRDEDQILETILEYTMARGSELSPEQVEELWATCRFVDLSLPAWERVLELEQIPARWLKLGMMARLVRKEQGAAEYEAFIARHGGSGESLTSRRLQRRKRHHNIYFLHFSSPFDTNGVLYWIGTHGRTRTYQNPHESGDVMVTFSRKGTGKEAHFVQHTNSSQDCHTDDEQDSWMQVNLGAGRSLRANYYCLRHGLRLNEYCLRSWQLQASNDGSCWTVLHERVDDTSLTGGGFSTAAWPIAARDRIFYRVFRLLQTGPSHSTCSDNLRVACAGIELYGDFRQER